MSNAKTVVRLSPYFSKAMPKKSPIKVQYDRDHPPEHWQQVYDNIVTMRQDASAPVDTMGCERAHDAGAAPSVQRFQCLVSFNKSTNVDNSNLTHGR